MLNVLMASIAAPWSYFVRRLGAVGQVWGVISLPAVTLYDSFGLNCTTWQPPINKSIDSQNLENVLGLPDSFGFWSGLACASRNSSDSFCLNVAGQTSTYNHLLKQRKWVTLTLRVAGRPRLVPWRSYVASPPKATVTLANFPLMLSVIPAALLFRDFKTLRFKVLEIPKSGRTPMVPTWNLKGDRTQPSLNLQLLRVPLL